MHNRTTAARRRRLDPDTRLGLELTLWGIAAFVVLVPFGVLLALVRSHSSGLQSVDQNVAANAHTLAIRHPGLVRFLNDVSTAGAPRTFWVLVALIVIVLVVRRAGRLALWAAVTMAGAALLDNVIKTVADRARPYFADPVATAPGKSFPSGHALESLAGCAILRVTLGVHYLSDVVGGWIFAAGWVAATMAAFRIWRRKADPQSTQPGALDPAGSQRLVKS
jgi:membrane-associated phospholipid phosphatase